MRKLVSTAFIASMLVGVSGAAMAADLPVKARPMVPVVAAYNWTGCYIGANGGGKWASTSGTLTIGPTALSAGQAVLFDRQSTSTAIFGGQVGCNWQAPGSNWVLGVEGDADWQRWSTVRTLPANLPPVLVAGDSFDVRSRWQGSARARLGYAWDRWMLYATGGIGFTNVAVGTNFIVTGIFPASAAVDSKTIYGPTVGAGFEYAFTNNFSFGLEGRYTWYGTQTYNGGQVAAVAVPGAAGFTFLPAAASQSMRVDTVEVTARLNWKLF